MSENPEALKIDYSQRADAGREQQLFKERTSPYHYLSTAVPAADLECIVGAARWSPSSFNEQPWKIYTGSGLGKDKFVQCLLEGNRVWAGKAPVLGFFSARRNFKRNGKENSTAQFDTGSAWMAMCLQANMLGYLTHGMAGFSLADTYDVFELDPAEDIPLCFFTIGKIDLSQPHQASGRVPLTDTWSHSD